MAGNGLNVKEIEEIKRLWKLGLKNRKIAKALGVHRNTVNKYVAEWSAPSLPVAPEAIVGAEVEDGGTWILDLDWEKIRGEYLQGVSLNVIHQELYESNKVPVQYSGFWKQLKKKLSLSEATMVRVFKPGSRIEIDYADGIDILDPISGELRKTQFFVGVLCHSRYTFAEFTWSQKSEDFLESHVNMFDFFQGTAQILSPDNLKSAVTKATRYDPVINQGYTRLAEHFGVAVVPARVRTPKDKAIVERTIQIFQKWFFMKVRDRLFTSLTELNLCLKEHLVLFNQKQHRIFRRSRAEMFADERAHLGALPVERYKVATYHRAKLCRDCHLEFEKNFYSAPHGHRGKELDVWATQKSLEIYFDGERIAFHVRSHGRGSYFTDTNHYPAAHQAYADEDIEKIITRAVRVGAETEELIRGLLEGPCPLRHYRRCQGMLALSRKHSPELLEQACKQANNFRQPNLQYLERVIKASQGVKQQQSPAIIKRSSNPHLRGVESIH